MHIFDVLIVTLQQRHYLVLKSQHFFKLIQSNPIIISPEGHMHQDFWLIRENNKRSMKYLFARNYFNTLSIPEKILGYKRLLASKAHPDWLHIPVILWPMPMGKLSRQEKLLLRSQPIIKAPVIE